MKPQAGHVRPVSVLLVALLAATAGCSSDSDDPDPTPGVTPDGPGTTPDGPGTTPDGPGTTPDGPGTTPDGPGTTPDGPGTTPDGPVSELIDGTWARACGASDADDPETTYDTVTLTIDGASATSTRLDFIDSACLTPVEEGAETVIDVAIAYPGGTTTTPRGDALHVDVTPESITIDGVAPTAEEEEVLASAGAFDVQHDIAVVSGDELYFGDLSADEDLDGVTPERRPTALESTPYLRQP